MRYVTFLGMIWLGSLVCAAGSSPTGWSPVVLPTGTYRTQIKSLPIHQRPGRPLHVYGNFIRLMDQSERDQTIRPIRQVFFGTHDLRAERERFR
ncbi:hypothetical protein NHH03_13530 [Stieleria sp. TO1_6]|nr:hypothetical protein [Stieleria tagensis]